VTAVRTSRLVRRFDATTAVDGVDLEIAPGEVRGLLGPNGAGKTTLLRMLLGLIRPDAGTIELLGRPIDASGVVPLDGVGGFVEDPAFYPYLSGRANLRLLARLDGSVSGSSGHEIESAIDNALERVGLGQRGGDRVGGYSTGMRQRLGLAAALLRRPRLLLLDEPTSGLDPAGVNDVSALVVDLVPGDSPVEPGQDLEVGPACEVGIESRLLDEAGHAGRDAVFERLNRPAEELDLACVRGEQSEKQSQEGRLASAVRTQQPADLPWRNREVGLVDRGRRLEALGQSAGAYGRWVRRRDRRGAH